MGQVYLAQDTSELNRTVAIKLLPSEVAADPKWMQRFIREARTVSGLNHPNVLTIYEFGVHDSTRFMAMEYVDGVTLREHLNSTRLNLHEVLDIGIQVAAALNAAHEAHVIHRDIKPENIMLRWRDSIVKVLDFGLAKPVRQDGKSNTSSELLHTETGIVMGTVSYMSPEQSLALKTIDYRTDIWSLGAVLYEMTAGRVPFEGKDLVQQIIAIQERPHAPLSKLVEHVPEELERVIDKALAKNPDERYQTATDMLNDMRSLKRQLENQAENDRTALFQPPVLVRQAATTQSGRYPVSSAEYIVNQVKLHKRGALILLGVFALAAFATVFWYFKHNRVAPLTDKDTILLGEFENKTGETVFDDTLRQGLAVQLQQSPFLDIFPETRTRATLQLMSLSPDERVTRERAREICQRQGLKAFIAGTIVKFERNYSITLEALNGQTGDQLALVQVEAEGKDQVLRALSRATTELREKLGEGLNSIQKFDAKLEVTTSSLEALKEYALGRSEQDRGQFFKAIEFYKRATEMDPNFAVAWLGLALQYANTSQPGLAAESLSTAFALSNRVSEDERARITYFYYQIVTGELEKAIEGQEAYLRSYPRAARGPGNLGNLYSITGQFEKAVAATSEAQRLNPNTTIWPGNLAEALIGLNRFDDARDVCQKALGQKLDSTSIRERLYTVAFVSGDVSGSQEQIAWAKGRTDEYRAVYWLVQSSAFSGKLRESDEHLQRAIQLALRADAKEVVAGYTADQALRGAWLGQFAQSLTLAQSALNVERNRNVLTRVALAFALAGEVGKAQTLIEEIEQKHPKDTLVNQVWLPEIKAAIQLRKNNAQAALELLETTKRYEAAAALSPQMLRSMVYLKLGQGAQVAAEARRILDHRGQGPLSTLWPLAHLALARASAMQGDTAQARHSYQDFFTLWKDADQDLPILIEAKREFER
ncbi:MAG: eukaryotic-like serine/threonine-protein kinase [Acidobacteriota bacterium]|jgi:serine/threonine protein kinase/tetratricopeptide (TPR) repeat protein